MNMIQVKKKGDHRQNFDRQKIMMSVMAAGGTEEEAEEIADEISKMVYESKEVVDTAIIREKVLAFLKGRDPEAAKNYETFIKPKREETEETEEAAGTEETVGTEEAGMQMEVVETEEAEETQETEEQEKIEEKE